MSVRPRDDYRALDKAGEYGCDSRADDAERGRAEFAEDEDVVEHEVDEHSGDARLHRQHRLAGLAQGAGIYLRHRERQHLEVHHSDVVLRVAERRAEVKSLVSLVQEGGDQVLAEEDEHEQEQRD